MSQQLKFDPEWRTTLFTLLLLPLMVFLGFWQLQRADEKSQLATSFEQRQLQPPAPLVMEFAKSDAGALAYLPVQLTGHFREQQYFLLDNRMHAGQYGNDVLGIFELEDGGIAVVNRGWIRADSSRQRLPEVPSVNGNVQITGHLYVAPGEPYLLAEQILAPGWPKQVQAVEMPKLEAAIGSDQGVFPYPVRIDSGQAGALEVNWQVINISPAKHRGYAVQWFAMAAVLSVIYLLRSSNLWKIIRRNSRVDAKDQ